MAVTIAFALGACGRSDAGEAAAVVVRDSAGVTIVENPAVPPAAGDRVWRLSTAPIVDIGAVDGAPQYQLYRVTDALRLEDGRIVVANAGTGELRFYGPEGEFRRAAGGEGEGPGEFAYLSALEPYPGDSILAWDGRLDRYAIFTADGRFVRDARVRAVGPSPRPGGVFPDGSLLVFDWRSSAQSTQPVQQHADLLRHSPDGAVLDTLGRFPTYRAVRVDLDEQRFLMGGEIFAPSTSVAVARSRAYVGTGHRPEVVVLTTSGTPDRLIRWPAGDRVVTQDHIDRYRAAALDRARTDEQRRRFRHGLDSTPFADEFAAYREIRTDRDGNLWVRRHDRPGYDGPGRWWVFDLDGRGLAAVEGPRRLHVYDIGRDYVLGAMRDDLDVEHVRLYRLVKEGA